MIFETHTPEKALSNFIADIVFYEDAVLPYTVEKLLPDGSIFLLLDMENGEKKLFNNDDFTQFQLCKGTYLSGQHKHFIHIEVTHKASMMVVRFKPGGAYPFFDFPMSDINNKVVQCETLMGSAIEDIRKAIIAEKDLATKFSLIESFLMGRVRKDYVHNTVFAEMLEFLQTSPHLVDMKELAARINVSQKHLISLFDKQVGLTPKALARIFRFQKVIQQLEKETNIDWMQISTDCGYYDQAHFIKDFYEFSGINPSSYPAQKGEFMNYIPVQ